MCSVASSTPCRSRADVPVITARLAVAATAVAVLLLFLPGHIGWFWGLNVLLVVATIADYLRTVDPRSLEVRRQLPSSMRIDTEAELRWWVADRDRPARERRTLRVHLADELMPSLGARTRRPQLSVPAGGAAHAVTTIRPTRRGRFRPTMVTVRVYGPVGLAARQRTQQQPDQLVVLPAFPSRKQAELRITRAQLADAGERTSRARGSGGEFDSLRDYTVDDEFRRIDWAATARARAPVVRVYRAEQNQTVLILVDAGRTMAGRVGDVPRLDFGMDAAMGLTLVATRLGDRAGLVVFDESVRAVVPPRGKRDQLSVVSTALADTYPELVEADYRAAFVATLSRFRRRALLVILTDLTPGSVEQTLLPALPLVSRRHEVIVAGVSDPTVEAWAVGEPTEAAAAFRAAAAARELGGRRDLRRRLQSAGAHVVDARPGELAGALADAYLRLKSSGGL